MKIAVEFYIDDEEKKALDWFANWLTRIIPAYMKMTAEDIIPIAVRHFIAREILPEMKEEREVFNDE